MQTSQMEKLWKKNSIELIKNKLKPNYYAINNENENYTYYVLKKNEGYIVFQLMGIQLEK